MENAYEHLDDNEQVYRELLVEEERLCISATSSSPVMNVLNWAPEDENNLEVIQDEGDINSHLAVSAIL